MKTRKSRLITAALVLLLSQTADAQYNNTYTGGLGTSIDIATAGGGSTCVLGTNTSFPIILKKIDFSGTPLWDFGYDFSSIPYNVRPTKVLATKTGDFIVVGIANDANTYNPFAAKFNSSGTFQWFNIFTSNPAVIPPAQAAGSLEKVNICEVMDDAVNPNTYIITATGTDPFMSGATGYDDVINVLRINSAGTLLWNKKYYPPFPYNTPNDDVREQPESITYASPTGGTKRYVITGSSDYLLLSGTTYNGFFMGVDKAGNIVDPYQRIALPNPRHFNAIFDNPDVVVAYTCTNSYVSLAASSGSSIGLSRINTTSGLSWYQSDFYAFAGASETDEKGLTMNAAKTKYVLAWDIYDGVPATPSVMGMTEINKSTSTLGFSNDYNYLRETKGAAIIDAVKSGERYVLLGTPINAGGSAGMRLVGEDMGVNTVCGRHPRQPEHATFSFTPPPTSYLTYNIQLAQNGYTPVTVFLTGMNSCTSPADYYKPSGVETASMQSGMAVYPTLLNTETAVNLDVNAESANKINVSLSAIDGKIISSTVFNTTSGKNHFLLDVKNLVPGTYVLNITSADGSLNKTIKLSKL